MKSNRKRRLAFGLLLAAVLPLLGCARSAHADSASVGDLKARLGTADAVHLLQRTGFGARAQDVLRLTGLSRAQAVDWIVARAGAEHPDQARLPDWAEAPSPLFWARSDLTAAERQRFDRARDMEVADLRRWWVSRMLDGDTPERERMVLFWHDLMPSAYSSLGGRSAAMARQNRLFRQHAFGSWRTLLQQLLRDPAMLMYLDNNRNRRDGPNENLGRELLELFTLGEGHFSEADVKAAARTLTGYSINQNRNHGFDFQPWQHDDSVQVLFGESEARHADELIEAILAQPRAAQFMAEHFWYAFISDLPAEATTIDALAEVFRQSDYSIKSLYRATLQSDAFWREDLRATLVKSPADLLIGIARTLDYPRFRRAEITAALSRAGLNLFEPPNVSGWKEGSAWIAPGRLLNRLDALREIALPTEPRATHGGRDRAGAAMMTLETPGPEQMMIAPNAMAMMDASKPAGLSLRLAAENYQGPPEFTVRLYQAQSVIWESQTMRLANGHDTERNGKLADISALPWQSVQLSLPEQLDTATVDAVGVVFANDVAGPDGDRNLYVAGGELQLRRFDSLAAVQHGRCPPKNSANAGNLYCNGEVVMAIPADTALAHAGERIRVGKVHVQTVRLEAKIPALRFTLEDVALGTPGQQPQFKTLSAEYQFHPQGVELLLQQQHCWPDCLVQWPDCATQRHDEVLAEPLHQLRIALATPRQADARCTLEDFEPTDQRLLSGWLDDPQGLIDAARETARVQAGDQQGAEFRQALDRLEAVTEPSGRSHWYIDRGAFRDPPLPLAPPQMPPDYINLEPWLVAMQEDGLSLETLLVPTTATATASVVGDSPQARLRAILLSPLFQLK